MGKSGNVSLPKQATGDEGTMTQQNVLKMGALALTLVGVAALMFVLNGSAAPALASPPAQSDYPVNTITVGGFGQASGAPDVVYLQLGVNIVSEDVGGAVAQANETMTAVRDALLEAGVAQEDMQTSGFGVWAEDVYGDQGPTGARRYHVDNTLRLTLRDAEQTQAVIDTALNAGANNIYGLEFGIEDRVALEQEARLDAVADARERAAQLAEAVGAELGEVIIVNEAVSGGFPTFEYAGLGGGGGAGPIEQGQLTVSVQVEVTFSISR